MKKEMIKNEGVFMAEKTIHLLYGTESLLFDTYVQKIQEKYIPEEEIDFAVTHYDLEEIPIEYILEDASTPPFFGEYKLLVVHRAHIFTGEKLKQVHDLEVFLSFLDSPAPFSIIVFIVPKEKLDERKKITKKCKEVAYVEAFLSPKKEADFLKYIEETCSSYGVKIAYEAAQKMFMLVGQNLSLLHQEIQKCVTYLLSEENKEISLAIVEALVSRSIEDDVFQLTDYLMKKNPSFAIFVLNDLKKQRVEPILILGALTSNFRLFYQVKILLGMGYVEREIASQLKVSPYRVKLAMQRVRNISKEALMEWTKCIAELDESLKTFQADGYLSLELFMLRFQ